jgi:hypothetical protein
VNERPTGGPAGLACHDADEPLEHLGLVELEHNAKNNRLRSL